MLSYLWYYLVEPTPHISSVTLIILGLLTANEARVIDSIHMLCGRNAPLIQKLRVSWHYRVIYKDLGHNR